VPISPGAASPPTLTLPHEGGKDGCESAERLSASSLTIGEGMDVERLLPSLLPPPRWGRVGVGATPSTPRSSSPRKRGSIGPRVRRTEGWVRARFGVGMTIERAERRVAMAVAHPRSSSPRRRGSIGPRVRRTEGWVPARFAAGMTIERAERRVAIMVGSPKVVIPAEAGIHRAAGSADGRMGPGSLRGRDDNRAR